MSRSPLPTKICAACGRTMTWRKSWAKNWVEVKYCSAGCRRSKRGPTDAALEASIRSLLSTRAHDATICPSEAARAVGAEDWRDLMEPARAAARRMVSDGEVEITQGGSVVDPSTARGPIRIRRRRT